MTVGVAYRVPGVGAVLVSDGRITNEGTIESDSERKLFECGPIAVIVAGDIGPFWRRMQAQPPKTFRSFMAAWDASEDDSDYLAYDRRSGHMWVSDVRIPSLFAAVGSGSHFALGALEAMPAAKTLEEAEAQATRAVRVAIKRHALCGGRVRVLTVRRRGRAPISHQNS